MFKPNVFITTVTVTAVTAFAAINQGAEAWIRHEQSVDLYDTNRKPR